MTDILILAERNIGKLIRKYLDREPLHVVHAEDMQELDAVTSGVMPGIVVVDQSHVGEGLTDVMAALATRFTAVRFIVLCSMEQTEYCEDLQRSFPGTSVTRLFKPIKLSALSSLIRDTEANTHASEMKD